MSTVPAGRVTDCHIHIQPLEELTPGARAAFRYGKAEVFERVEAIAKDPKLLLPLLDAAGIWRAALINYVSPDIMGFTDHVNEFVARYASHDRTRLIPIGGIHPRLTKDGAGDVDRIAALGIAGFKIHPSHQSVAANAYVDGLSELRALYRRAEERGMPVMIHTGTSIFPGARNRFGNPMEIDDVAVDFPKLTIVMAHGGRPLWMNEAMFILRRHPNVWLDVSSIPPAKLLEYFPRLEEFSGRAVWGSDWPGPGVRDMGKNLTDFLALPLTDAAKRRITVENPLRVFPEGKG